jgi:hypothetical protein
VLLGYLFRESLITSVQSAALSAANAESILVLCLLVSVLDFSGAATDPVLVFKTHFGFSYAHRVVLSFTLVLCFGPGFRRSGIGMPWS